MNERKLLWATSDVMAAYVFDPAEVDLSERAWKRAIDENPELSERISELRRGLNSVHVSKQSKLTGAEIIMAFHATKNSATRGLLEDVLWLRMMKDGQNPSNDIDPIAEANAMVSELGLEGDAYSQSFETLHPFDVLKAILSGELKLKARTYRWVN